LKRPRPETKDNPAKAAEPRMPELWQAISDIHRGDGYRPIFVIPAKAGIQTR
jgi:hypothetical protein